MTTPPPRPLTGTIVDLRAFVAVAEHGSFSKAAASLGVSQPTVSQRIQSLEQSSGLRLLNRRSGVTLTEDGRDLFKRARLLVSRFDEFEEAVSDLRQLRRGRLRLGFSSPAYAMAALRRFREDHPNVQIETRLGNTASLSRALEECVIDVAIVTLQRCAEAFSYTLLAEQAPRLCVPSDHPWAADGEVPPSALDGLGLIQRETGSMTRRLFEQACVTWDAKPSVVLEVPSREAVKEAVAARLGIGVVLDGEIGEDRRLAGVRIVDAAGDPAVGVGGVFAIALPESRDLPMVAAFIEAAATAAATLAPATVTP